MTVRGTGSSNNVSGTNCPTPEVEVLFSCTKPVSGGTIAGSIIGGMFILIAGALGLIYMLRYRHVKFFRREREPMAVLDEARTNSANPSGRPAPSIGQGVIESHPLNDLSAGHRGNGASRPVSSNL